MDGGFRPVPLNLLKEKILMGDGKTLTSADMPVDAVTALLFTLSGPFTGKIHRQYGNIGQCN